MKENRAYEFGNLRLNVREGLLLRHGEPIPLTPKAFETLVALVENSGHVLGKDELMKRVWPDSFVEDNNLSQNISQLRKALNASGESASQYIETIPRRGYRFKLPVTVKNADADSLSSKSVQFTRTRPEVHSELIPETKYARSGEVNIAYQVMGDGPLDLVFVMGWISHLEYFWREPSFAYFLRRLASFSRLILFDKRGTGLSDRVPLDELPTLEQRMDDVRVVLEAVGSSRAAICGVSEGGPMSGLFAATYPERTAALVMIGTYAKRIWAPEYPWAPTAEHREHFFNEIRSNWGGPVGLEERAPSKINDPDFIEWWATYLRMGASPGAAMALTKMNAEVDVRHVLPSIRVPTLVLHRTGDRCLKVEEGRFVASLIPNATYIELPGEDHLPFVGDQDELLDEIERFLTGARPFSGPERVLATVLFTDIVQPPHGSMRRDEASWSELLQRFRAYISKQITAFRGREIDMVGSGALATFDGPARAVRCACTINEYASRLAVGVRSGVHTGECDLLENNSVTGVTVDVGRAIRNHAAQGEVLVSHTVKDLIAGSGISFEERGTESFNGVDGEWRLYKVAAC
ncbi:MAG TPA: alpha/beta fold hydrolase [Pyrinomonadaceae bacterium]|nr:alpha/beta fold hydrolase [Pyrinomonadaceae bacterium]